MANRTPKLDKGGISYPESRSLIGYIRVVCGVPSERGIYRIHGGRRREQVD